MDWKRNEGVYGQGKYNIQLATQTAIKKAVTIIKLILKGYDDSTIAEKLSCREDEVRLVREKFNE